MKLEIEKFLNQKKRKNEDDITHRMILRPNGNSVFMHNLTITFVALNLVAAPVEYCLLPGDQQLLVKFSAFT